ncbi:MAG: hypothetical protein ACKO9V_02340, partial [Candidatus Kapaibacterium sp.]
MASIDVVRRIIRCLMMIIAPCFVCGSSGLPPSLMLDLRISAPMPQDLSAWSHDTSGLHVDVRSTSTDTCRVLLRMVLFKDSTVIAYTRAHDGRIKSIDQKGSLLCSRELFPENGTEYLWSLSRAVTRRGTVRPGAYHIQCQALDPDNSDDVMASTGLIPCTVVGFESPALVEPPTYHWLSRSKDAEFRWRPLSPLPSLPHSVRYRFLLFEVPDGTDPDGVEERCTPMYQRWSSMA